LSTIKSKQICKERIEKEAKPSEKGNLLAATRVMAEMKYNDLELLSLFGVANMSLLKVYEQSRSVQWYTAIKAREEIRKLIVRTLERKFGPLPMEVVAYLNATEDHDRLVTLHDAAVDSTDLAAFRAALTPSA
jgi:hypothetical protein